MDGVENAKKALWTLFRSLKAGESAELVVTTEKGSLKVTLKQSFPANSKVSKSNTPKRAKKRAGPSRTRRKVRRAADPAVQQRAAEHASRTASDSEASSVQGEAMSSPEKERGSGAPIPLGTSPVKDEEREEIEDALEVESEVEKTPRIRLEVPADFADRADNDQWDCDANYALAREADKLMGDTDMCCFCDFICPPPSEEENKGRLGGMLQSLCDHVELEHPLAWEWLG